MIKNPPKNHMFDSNPHVVTPLSSSKASSVKISQVVRRIFSTSLWRGNTSKGKTITLL